VQYLPEQTHVYTTTQFSPATKTTILEADHLPAYSAPKPVFVAPVRDHHYHDPDDATIYSFSHLTGGARLLAAPLRLAEKILLSRRRRIKLNVNSRPEKKRKREKKIFVFGDRRKGNH